MNRMFKESCPYLTCFLDLICARLEQSIVTLQLCVSASLFQKLYSTVAEAKILESFYYQGSNKVLPADKKVDEKDLPALVVFKDKKHYKYEGRIDIHLFVRLSVGLHHNGPFP